MLALCLVIVFISPSFCQEVGCGFNDDMFVPHEGGGGGGGGLESAIEQCCVKSTRWDGDRVPYYFTKSFPKIDRKMVKTQMRKIEENSCITFKQISDDQNKPRHVLKIDNVRNKNTVQTRRKNNKVIRFKPCTWGGVSTKPRRDEVVMELNGDGTDGCKPGLVMHELFHTLGMLHTHRRHDRDKYVRVNWDCVRRLEDTLDFNATNFKVLKDAEPYDVDYKCNSIMHYRNWFKECEPLIPINCPDGMGYGPYSSPLDEDWDILNKEHCSNYSNGGGASADASNKGPGGGDGGNASPTKARHDIVEKDSDGLWSELVDFYKIIKFARSL